jgi:omega-amidase
MQNLTVTLIQQPLVWLDREANLRHFSQLIEPLAGTTDLIILPEMFSSGFSMNPAPIAEPMDGITLQWLAKQASQCGAAITGSFTVKENDQFYNRMVFMRPNGEYHHYDKRHLFRMGNEHHRYQGGNERLIVDYLGWRICPMICYDLRFPAWSRNSYNDNKHDYDLLIFVANWPQPRHQHWLSLLRARAIENLSYVAGVNRLGKDGNNLDYSGNSALYDAWGNELINAESEASCFSQTLDYQALQKTRQQFPAHLDADNFKLNTLNDLGSKQATR